MTSDRFCVVSLVASLRGLRGWAFVRDQVGGALSSAAVPRVCLGQTAPPLCRCAKCTTALILAVWLVLHGCRVLVLETWWAFHRRCRYHRSGTAGIASTQTHTAGCPGAWLGRRSGIKEESSALGRNGGQPRSRPSQAHGRANHRGPKAEPTTDKPMPFGPMHFTQPTSS
jgi:hypothetical protein